MGHRGIYTVISNGQKASYYTHWGVASPFSIFRRVLCALELKEHEYADKSIHDIFANLGETGEYVCGIDENRMFELLSVRCKRIHIRDFNRCGYLEMRVTLNFDTNTAFLEHNPRYCHYKYVGNYFIPLDQGIHSIKTVLGYAEKAGIDDVNDIAGAFHRQTGIEEVYQNARNIYDAETDRGKHGSNPHNINKNPTSPLLGARLLVGSMESDLER